MPLVLAIRELMMLRYGGSGRRRFPAKPPVPRPSGEASRPVLPAGLIPNLLPLNQATRKPSRPAKRFLSRPEPQERNNRILDLPVPT